jgi:hypothetical protein
MASFKYWLDEFDRGNKYFSPDLAARIYPARQTWRDFLIEYRKASVPQPVAVECFHTREKFECP